MKLKYLLLDYAYPALSFTVNNLFGNPDSCKDKSTANKPDWTLLMINTGLLLLAFGRVAYYAYNHPKGEWCADWKSQKDAVACGTNMGTAAASVQLLASRCISRAARFGLTSAVPIALALTTFSVFNYTRKSDSSQDDNSDFNSALFSDHRKNKVV